MGCKNSKLYVLCVLRAFAVFFSLSNYDESTNHVFMKSPVRLDWHNPVFVLPASYGLLAVVGLLDYWTGPDISFSIFYIVPISLITWFMNRSHGFVAAFVCALIWLVIDVSTGATSLVSLTPYWNAIVRLGFFALTVVLIAKIQDLNRRLVSLLEERTSAWVKEVAQRQRTERSLYESEKQFRMLIGGLNGAYFVSNAGGHIKYGSPEMVARSGYSEKEFIGMLYVRFIHTADRRRVVQFYLEQTKNGAQEVSCQFRICVRSGEIIWVELVTRIVRNGEGNVLEYHNILRDINKQKKAEEQILLLAHAVASTSQAVTITDEFNRFTLVNKAFLDMYGFTESEVLGKTPELILSEKNSPEKIREIAEETMRGGWSGELINRKKNGVEFPIFLTSSPVRNADGKVVGLMGFALDITERRRSQEMIRQSEMQFRTVVETMREGVVRVDNDNHIEYVNDRFCEMLGYGRGELFLLPSLDRLFCKEDLQFFDAQSAMRKNGEAGQYEIRLRKKSGALLWVQVSASPITDAGGAAIGSLGVVADVSERKRAEIALLKAEARLEKLFQPNPKDFDENAAMTREASRIMGDFALRIDMTIQRMEKVIKHVLSFSSLASHELRTPLAIIRNQLEESMRRKISLNKFRGDIASVYDETLRLQRTVTDLLAIGSMLAGSFKLDLQPLDFYNFLKNFYEEALFLTRDKDISVIFAHGAHATIRGDENMLRQVMFNLLDNAIKYIPRGGRIHLNYSVQDQKLVLNFSDNGSGISLEDRERIFDPFSRGSKVGTISGTGLGLTLVKLVVEAHNGSIQVDSEVGKRTTFLITLPLLEQSTTSNEQSFLKIRDAEEPAIHHPK